jgi:hypothetical protein
MRRDRRSSAELPEREGIGVASIGIYRELLDAVGLPRRHDRRPLRRQRRRAERRLDERLAPLRLSIRGTEAPWLYVADLYGLLRDPPFLKVISPERLLGARHDFRHARDTKR